MTAPKKFGRPPALQSASTIDKITFRPDAETLEALGQLVRAASEGIARIHIGRLRSAVIRQAVIEAAQRLPGNKKE